MFKRWLRPILTKYKYKKLSIFESVFKKGFKIFPKGVAFYSKGVITLRISARALKKNPLEMKVAITWRLHDKEKQYEAIHSM